METTLSLAASAKQLGAALKERGLILATAESCTGGGLSFWITSVSGSSHWFDRGFITYSDQSKIDLLNVNPHTLKNFGAVSEETAKEMAQGALLNSQADLSLAITGIAGPAGGTLEKPVGTVWFAWTGRDFKIQSVLCIFDGDRAAIRHDAVKRALDYLKKYLL